MGVGKIMVGWVVVCWFDLLFFDFDYEIEVCCGVCVLVIFEYEGEVGFCDCEIYMIDEFILCDGVVFVIGGGVVFWFENCVFLCE